MASGTEAVEVAEAGELPDFAEAVLAAVDQIPAGRVTTYGDIADYLGVGGPRQVGRVMAVYGAAVAWWRVIRANGTPAAGLEERALARLRAEGTAIRDGRVDLRSARWDFPADASPADVRLPRGVDHQLRYPH